MSYPDARYIQISIEFRWNVFDVQFNSKKCFLYPGAKQISKTNLHLRISWKIFWIFRVTNMKNYFTDNLVPCTLGLGEIFDFKIKTQSKPVHLYLQRKFNFEAGLFSLTFLFERSFCCPWALLVFRPYCSKNASKTTKNMRFLKIGLNPTQKC